MVVDHLNSGDVVLIHRVDEGINLLLLEVLCDTSKNPTITFSTGTSIVPDSNDFVYSIPASIWAGDGNFTVTISDNTGSETFTIAKATNENVNISLQKTGDTTYSLGTYVNLLDISENTVDTITAQTEEYPEVIAGNRMSTIIGKIKKFLSDLKNKVTSLSSDLAKKQDAATAITTSNIGSQSVNYATNAGSATSASSATNATNVTNAIKRGAWWTYGTSHDANDVVGDTVFAYNNQTNTATTGVLVGFSNVGANAGSYTFQLQNSYGGNGALYHRNRNGDNRTWNPWKKILDTSNYNDYCIRSYAQSGSFNKVGHIIEFSGSNNYLGNTSKGNYIWGVSAWSDSRLKKNIKDSQVNALELINLIQMREFDFKDETIGKHQDIGYVAHELMEVIPEAVVSVPVSEEMAEEYGAEELYQVEDKHIIKYLVKAVQELTDIVNKQQIEIEKLKGGN